MSDLSDLFSTDPLELTHDDYTKIVTEYRQRRHLFNSGIKPKRSGNGPKVPAQGQALLEEFGDELKV